MHGSSDEEKSKAINDFLREYYFNIIDSGRRVSEKNKHLYRYQVVFNGESPVKEITGYSNLHTILAKLILDLPQTENEHPFVTHLRKTIKKILEFAKDDTSEDTLVFAGYNKKYLSYYKPIIRFLVSSAKKPDSNLNLDLNSIKEVNDGLKYSISKKVEGEKIDNSKKKAEPVIIRRTFINS